MKKITITKYILLIICFFFTSNLFSQCITANVVATCSNSNNLNEYFIEITNIVGTDAMNQYTIGDGTAMQIYNATSSSTTFGPYLHSGSGLATQTISIQNIDGACLQTFTVLETLCGPTTTCDCTNANGALSILASSQPGTFNFTTHTNIYILSDGGGNVVDYNNTGYFPTLQSGGIFYVMAANVSNADVAAFTSILPTSSIIEIEYQMAPFDAFCYQSSSQILFAEDCDCFPCPVLSNLIAPNSICNNSNFSLSVNATTSMPQALNVQFVYKNINNDSPYLSGFVIGTANVINGVAVLNDANLPSGTYDVCAIVFPTPADSTCRPVVSSTIVINQTAPTITANAICNSVANQNQFFIEIANITGNDANQNYDFQIFEDGNNVAIQTGTFVDSILTFGPYNHSGTGLQKYTIVANNQSNAACSTELQILETLCGPATTCDCTNNVFPLSILSSMQPGTFNVTGYSPVYILTDVANNIINYNNTGLFQNLLDSVQHNIYAANVANANLTNFQLNLLNNNIADVLNFTNNFNTFCYDVLQTPAMFLNDCNCGNLDLVIDKNLAPNQPNFANVGSNIVYELQVINNSNFDVFNVEIDDIIPFGLNFILSDNTIAQTGNDNDWTINTGIATTTINQLLQNDTAILTLNLTVDSTFAGFTINNNAAISDFYFDDGNGNLTIAGDNDLSNNFDNQNIFILDCMLPVFNVINTQMQQVCNGELASYQTDFIAPNNAYTIIWLAVDNTGNIANYVEGNGVNFEGSFNTANFNQTDYCIFSLAYLGSFANFASYQNTNSINSISQIINDISSGLICAALSSSSCVQLQVFETPIANVVSTAILCNQAGGDFPNQIMLDSLIITPFNVGTGNWYINNNADTLFASNILDGNDTNLPTTIYYSATNGSCQSISYAVAIDVLDCSPNECFYDAAVLTSDCNNDGTYNLQLLIGYNNTLSDRFFVEIDGITYGSYQVDDIINLSSIFFGSLPGNGNPTNIIVYDSLSNTTIQPPVAFISEIHYDNLGGDVGESIEVTAIAGTNLSNYEIWLYNGATGEFYDNVVLSGIATNDLNGYGTTFINFASNGIQNGTSGGSGDGIALIDNSNSASPIVTEFLSYEGVITAIDGPAIGLLSTDILVDEPGAIGESLQLTDIGWVGPIANNFGTINTNLTVDTTAQLIVCEYNLPFTIPNCLACGFNPSFTISSCDSSLNIADIEINPNDFGLSGSVYNISFYNPSGPDFLIGTYSTNVNPTISVTANNVTTTSLIFQDANNSNCNHIFDILPFNCNTIFYSPSVSIEKNDADNLDDYQGILIGDDAVFTITITNSGNEPLTNIAISDPNGNSCNLNYTQNNGVLNVGDNFTYTCNVSGYTNNIFNEATVTAAGLFSNQTTTASDDTYVNVEDPNCTSGIIVNNSQTLVCANQVAQASFQNASSNQTFVLHNGNDFSIGTILGVNNTGIFPNNGSYPYNAELCITAIVSDVFNINGFPVANPNCYDISECLEVVFLQPINAAVSEICSDDGSVFNVNVQAIGGLPAFNSSEQYIFNNFSAANFAQTATVGPFLNNSSYTLNVVDGNGCENSFTFPTVSCNQTIIDTTTCNFIAGGLPTGETFVCANDFVTASLTGTFIDNPNAVTNYILQDANDPSIVY